MLPAQSTHAFLPHELVEAFQDIELPLNKTLTNMLNEAPEHQSPRRGSGFTQASRYLADLVNQPRGLTPSLDLKVFAKVGQNYLTKTIYDAHDFLEYQPPGLGELYLAIQTKSNTLSFKPRPLKVLQKLLNLPQTLTREESRLIANLILSILGLNNSPKGVLRLPLHELKLPIGTCPEAERYFLELSRGYLRRQGIVNVLTDGLDQPALVEKINLGDSHSCINLTNVILNKVLIPPGSLLGTRYTSLPINSNQCRQFKGVWLPASHCEGFRFLRLTTLAVSPINRARAFGNHFKSQLLGNPCFDPKNSCLANLSQVAKLQTPVVTNSIGIT